MSLRVKLDGIHHITCITADAQANVDFYAAPLFSTLGVPIETFTPVFASSRVVGWVAHYNEQLMGNRIYRPDAIYKGEKGLSYTPLDSR